MKKYLFCSHDQNCDKNTFILKLIKYARTLGFFSQIESQKKLILGIRFKKFKLTIKIKKYENVKT